MKHIKGFKKYFESAVAVEPKPAPTKVYTEYDLVNRLSSIYETLDANDKKELDSYFQK